MSVVLVCPTLTSPSSGNKDHLSCGDQKVMSLLFHLGSQSEQITQTQRM